MIHFSHCYTHLNYIQTLRHGKKRVIMIFFCAYQTFKLRDIEKNWYYTDDCRDLKEI